MDFSSVPNQKMLEYACQNNDTLEDEHFTQLSEILSHFNNCLQIRQMKLKQVEDYISHVPSLSTRLMFDEVQTNITQAVSYIQDFQRTIPKIKELGIKSNAIFTDIGNSINSTETFQKNLSDLAVNKSPSSKLNFSDNNVIKMAYPVAVEERNQRIFFNVFDNASSSFTYDSNIHFQPINSRPNRVEKNMDIEEITQTAISYNDYNGVSEVMDNYSDENSSNHSSQDKSSKSRKRSRTLRKASANVASVDSNRKTNTEDKISILPSSKSCPIINCKKSFKSPSAIKYHICSAHCEKAHLYRLSSKLMKVAEKKLKEKSLIKSKNTDQTNDSSD